MSESTGYLSADEVQSAKLLLPNDTPYAVCGISHGIFSLARHSGAMVFQGRRYTYFPEHDECVRDDVLQMVKRMRRRPRAGPAALQMTIDGAKE